MQLPQLQAFRIFVHEDHRVSEVRRNPFSQNESDAFVYERRNCKGEVQVSFHVMESTAELSLKCALAFVEKRPDLVSIEFDKLSAGTTFNYPVPQI